MPESDRKPPDEFSRSAVKNEMLQIQKLGEDLVKLSLSQLDNIPLPETLGDAIKFARTLKNGEAKRRQLQYIGKLMRKVDIEPIRTALKQIQQSHTSVTQEFHAAEEWRERLIAEGDTALQEFINLHSDADRQNLRQLVRQAQQNRKTGKNTGAETALFRFIMEILSST